jgi:hypothetical protein
MIHWLAFSVLLFSTVLRLVHVHLGHATSSHHQHSADHQHSACFQDVSRDGIPSGYLGALVSPDCDETCLICQVLHQPYTYLPLIAIHQFNIKAGCRTKIESSLLAIQDVKWPPLRAPPIERG